MAPVTTLRHGRQYEGWTFEIRNRGTMTDVAANIHRPRLTVSVANLIKFNVNALIRDRAMKSRAVQNHLEDALEIFARNNPNKPNLSQIFDVDALKKEYDPLRWTQNAVGERIGMKPGAIWRLLTPESEGGSSGFQILDLLLIAKELQVPIPFLLQPTREQIDSNGILIFPEFESPLEVTANQWLGWVNGLTSLPGEDATTQAFSALFMTTSHMAGWVKDEQVAPKAKTADDINIEDTKRITKGFLTASSPFLDAIQSSVGKTQRSPSDSGSGTLSEPLNDHQIAINRSHLLQRLSFHIREALIITSDVSQPGRVQALGKVAENLLNDILELGFAVDKDLPTTGLPFDKLFMLQPLEIICLMLEHLDLSEIREMGFELSVPGDVRLPKTKFEKEQNPPDYMEGAFRTREKLRKKNGKSRSPDKNTKSK